MKFFILLVSTLLATNALAEVRRDVKYDDKHARNVLDFYPPTKESTNPAPVYVFFHGGGFRKGDKKHISGWHRKTLKKLRDAGFAVASCNYPFLENGTDYRDIAEHCARAVQFVRSQSSAWGIDPDKLVCGGVSAGALISEFLAYHDDFAKKKSKDAVETMSSRPQVVFSMMQPIGTFDFALRYMDKGEAPVFIYSNQPKTDRLHPPKEAQRLHKKAKSLGIPTALYGGGANKLPPLPEGATWIDTKIAFLQKHLN